MKEWNRIILMLGQHVSGGNLSIWYLEVLRTIVPGRRPSTRTTITSTTWAILEYSFIKLLASNHQMDIPVKRADEPSETIGNHQNIECQHVEWSLYTWYNDDNPHAKLKLQSHITIIITNALNKAYKLLSLINKHISILPLSIKAAFSYVASSYFYICTLIVHKNFITEITSLHALLGKSDLGRLSMLSRNK